MRKTIPLLCVTMLFGCTSVTDVKDRSRGQYSVTGMTHNPFTSWGSIKQAASDRASEFCDEKTLQSHQVTMATLGVRGWRQRKADLLFECEPVWRAR
jgi:hypothetical protein